ncbi:MAG TPA: hypothetical protein VGA16_08995 [Candidatus Limnocylindria bacterium]
MASSNVRPMVLSQERIAALLFMAAERSRWAARECARAAAAAALVAIASVIANAALGIAVTLVLAGGLLARRVKWLGESRSQHADAVTAEMAASFVTSNWQTRTRWGLRRRSA